MGPPPTRSPALSSPRREPEHQPAPTERFPCARLFPALLSLTPRAPCEEVLPFYRRDTEAAGG